MVGYFGYEMKQECYGADVLKNEYTSFTSDSAFLFADRMVAFDHLENTTYLVAVVNTNSPAHQKDICSWFEMMQDYMRNPQPTGYICLFCPPIPF